MISPRGGSQLYNFNIKMQGEKERKNGAFALRLSFIIQKDKSSL
jgi:hypothetical protein